MVKSRYFRVGEPGASKEVEIKALHEWERVSMGAPLHREKELCSP